MNRLIERMLRLANHAYDGNRKSLWQSVSVALTYARARDTARLFHKIDFNLVFDNSGFVAFVEEFFHGFAASFTIV